MSSHVLDRNIWLLGILCSIVSVSSYHVDLVDDGPIVKGANITFIALVYDSDNRPASGSFRYTWQDTAVPTHSKTVESKSAIDQWTVLYNATIYPQGRYVAQVTVCKYYFVICVEVASNRVEFYINETLNGNLQLIQKNQTRSGIYVSNADTVIHNVSLKQSDADLVKLAPTVLTYWFVDCTYYGFMRGFQFPFNYTQADEEHFVEALVVADFTPLPPPPTTTAPTTTSTTTTTKPTTTKSTTTSTTTTKPTTTTTKSTTTSATTTTSTTTTSRTTTTTPPHKNVTAGVVKRSLDVQMVGNETSHIMVNINGTLQPYKGSFPFVCNSTQVATDSRKTYGYFFKKIKVRAPVTKVNITGNNWLQHGDLLTLNVKCHGSKNLKYCVQYQNGVYNITGNETCFFSHELEKCEFTIQRYFVESIEHTVIIIIQNEVSKVVTPVAVTVYKVKKQAQLSVIVVPVASSLVAVVLIVFGVAYYFQNRSRFVVEVADFNFGQNYSDMEYKTFKERLRDSIANAFFSRAPSPGSSEVPVWPPGRKYGSMTS
ncbi:uncharacterized protein [Tenebrio molitor]|jgi:hypothetical protein|uniref:uncharacterized protein isoform X1 n=1 Tax=Tenebrio molitor TaxID=7067 RepID=UPI00362492DE